MSAPVDLPAPTRPQLLSWWARIQRGELKLASGISIDDAKGYIFHQLAHLKE